EVMGKAQDVGDAMHAVSRGDLGAAAGAVRAASGIPTASAVGSSLQTATAAGEVTSGGGGAVLSPPSLPSGDPAGGLVGLDKLIQGALDASAGKLGEALGRDGSGGGGGGGSGAANTAGPSGGAEGNAAADSTTGPGFAINRCASTHAETVGGLKVTLAAAGI